MGSLSGGLDGVGAVFDEGRLVADAGLLLAGSLVGRLGLEAMLDEVVRPSGAGRGSGAKLLTAVSSMLAGGSFIDDADRLRSGSGSAVLWFAVAAPSTLGTFSRSFTWGHVRQLDRALELALGRALRAGASPPPGGELTVDIDSTVCEVQGRAKQAAAYGHTAKCGCGAGRRSGATPGSSPRPSPEPGGWRRAQTSRCARMPGSSPGT